MYKNAFLSSSAKKKERNKDYKLTENQYDILLSDISEPPKLAPLQRYKAKVVRLHAKRMEKVMLDNNAQDKIGDEEPSLFHIMKMVKRQEIRVIRQILDIQGNYVSGHLNVLKTFVTHLRRKE